MPGPVALIYAWDGSRARRLRTESATQYNLRVALYDAGDKMVSDVLDGGSLATTHRGLVTLAAVHGWDGTITRPLSMRAPADALANPSYALDVLSHLAVWDSGASTWDRLQGDGNGNVYAMLRDGATAITSRAPTADSLDQSSARALDVQAYLYMRRSATEARAVLPAVALSDGDSGNNFPGAALMCWDGAAWDRVRGYGNGILKVVRAEGGLSNSGVLSADTSVKASAGKVYWITVSDTAALAIELNDSTDNTGTDLWAIDLPANGYIHVVFDPPLEFATGIYLDVSTATCKVTIGYL